MTANECEADGHDILQTNTKSELEHHHCDDDHDQHHDHETEASIEATEAEAEAEAIQETSSASLDAGSRNILVGDSDVSSTNEQTTEANASSTTTTLTTATATDDKDEDKEDGDEMRLRKHHQQQQQDPTTEPTDSSTDAPKSRSIFGGILSKIGKAFGHHHLHHHHHHQSASVAAHQPVHSQDKIAQKVHQHHLASLRIRHRRDVLLFNCSTIDEHCECIYQTIEKSKSLHGSQGLRQLGFEFRLVSDSNDHDQHHHDHDDITSADSTAGQQPTTTITTTDSSDRVHKEIERGSQYVMSMSTTTNTTAVIHGNDTTTFLHESSHSHSVMRGQISGENSRASSMRRLFHIESNTMITMDNRQKFIADGDMYDAVARLCQQVAQTEMMKDGNLEWITLHEAGNNSEPVQALVSAPIAKNKEHLTLDRKPTLLIATGKGKVRAGVFSRQHLMTSGMECSTALPLVREAIKRNMNIVMLDPNVHGERMGMVTFEKSMSKLFQRWETSSDEVTSPQREARELFILSHSQSGAQLARYLLEKSEHYLPHIRAIAFTDSTHNIQWTRNNESLRDLLQCDRCIYYKSTAGDACDCESVHEPLETAGEEVETDNFWKHRFGSISTRCAGTSEHALTNWFVRSQIWKHFDGFMQNDEVNSNAETPQ